MLLAAPGQLPPQCCNGEYDYEYEYCNGSYMLGGAMSSAAAPVQVVVPYGCTGVVFAVPADHARACSVGSWQPIAAQQMAQPYAAGVEMQHNSGIEVASLAPAVAMNGAVCGNSAPCGSAFIPVQVDCSTGVPAVATDGIESYGMPPHMAVGVQGMAMPMADVYAWQLQQRSVQDQLQEQLHASAAQAEVYHHINDSTQRLLPSCPEERSSSSRAPPPEEKELANSRNAGKIFMHDSDGLLRHVAQCSNGNGRVEVDVIRRTEEPQVVPAALQKTRQARAAAILGNASGVAGPSSCSGSDSPTTAGELSSAPSARSLASSAETNQTSTGRGGNNGSSTSERLSIAPSIRIARRRNASEASAASATGNSLGGHGSGKQPAGSRWAGNARIAAPTARPPPPPPPKERSTKDHRCVDISGASSSSSSTARVAAVSTGNTGNTGIAATLEQRRLVGVASKPQRPSTISDVRSAQGAKCESTSQSSSSSTAGKKLGSKGRKAAASAVPDCPRVSSPVLDEDSHVGPLSLQPLSRAVLHEVYLACASHGAGQVGESLSLLGDHNPALEAMTSKTNLRQRQQPQQLQRSTRPLTKSERKLERRRAVAPTAVSKQTKGAFGVTSDIDIEVSSQSMIAVKVISFVSAAVIAVFAVAAAWFLSSAAAGDAIIKGGRQSPAIAQETAVRMSSGSWSRVVQMPAGSSKFAWHGKAAAAPIDARDEQSIGALIRRLDVEAARALASLRSSLVEQSSGNSRSSRTSSQKRQSGYGSGYDAPVGMEAERQRGSKSKGRKDSGRTSSTKSKGKKHPSSWSISNAEEIAELYGYGNGHRPSYSAEDRARLKVRWEQMIKSYEDAYSRYSPSQWEAMMSQDALGKASVLEQLRAATNSHYVYEP